MTNFKKVALICGAVVLGLVSCKNDKDVKVTGIALNKTSLELAVGESATLQAALTPKDAAGTIEWKSENTAIATVAEGKVVGVAEGETNVVASCAGFSATCKVTVKAGSGPQPGGDEPVVEAEAGVVKLVWNVKADVCNGLAFAGNYNDYNTTDEVDAKGNAPMVRFSAIEGFEGWYVASIPATGSEILGKGNQVNEDGTFPSDWAYQWVDGAEAGQEVTVLKGNAEMRPDSYEGEVNIAIAPDADVVYVVSYAFKNNPCVEPDWYQITFNLETTLPVENDGVVYIVGDAFEQSWTPDAYPMNKVDANHWTITMDKAQLGKSYKYVVNGSWDNDQMLAPEEGADCSKKAGNLKVEDLVQNDAVYGFLNFGAVKCEETPVDPQPSDEIKAGDELVVNVKLGEGLDLGENKLYIWSWGQSLGDQPLEMALNNGVYNYTFVVAEADVEGWANSGMLFVATTLGEGGAMNWDGKLGQTGDIKPIQAGTWVINSDWTVTKE